MAKARTSKVAEPQSKQQPKSATQRLTRKHSAPEASRVPAPPQAASTGATERKTKQSACLILLARPNGATIEDLQTATGWQPHSVRGFLAGAVKKKLGLTLVSSKADGDARRYRVVDAGAGGR